MRLMYKGAIYCESRDPETIFNVLLHEVSRPIIMSEEDIEKIGLVNIIAKVLEDLPDFSIPDLDFFMFLEDHKIYKEFFYFFSMSFSNLPFSEVVRAGGIAKEDYLISFFIWPSDLWEVYNEVWRGQLVGANLS